MLSKALRRDGLQQPSLSSNRRLDFKWGSIRCLRTHVQPIGYNLFLLLIKQTLAFASRVASASAAIARCS
jgi:hypothetical protein